MRSLLPKMKKKLAAFFTDESGKISKENILSMGVGGMILVGLITDSANASHSSYDEHSNTVPHSSSPGGHVSSNHANTGLAGHASGTRNGSVYEFPTSGHLSAPHVSGNTHSNHGSHANHVSHVDVWGDG